MSYIPLKDGEPPLNLFADIRMLSDDEHVHHNNNRVGGSRGKRKAEDDHDHHDIGSPDGHAKSRELPIIAGDILPPFMLLQKEPEQMRFNLRTVLRWKVKDSGVVMDHIYGFGDNATPDERSRAEQILQEGGHLVCTICRSAIIGRHSQHVLNHQSSRGHRQALEALKPVHDFYGKQGMAPVPVSMVNNVPRPVKRVRRVQARGRSLEGVRQAFTILLDDSKVKGTDLSKLKKKLALFCITGPQSLFNLSAVDTEILASFLRKIPRKEFLSAMETFTVPASMTENQMNAVAASSAHVHAGLYPGLGINIENIKPNRQSKRDAWSPDEDRALLKYVEDHAGVHHAGVDWTEVEQRIHKEVWLSKDSSKSGKQQCRERWYFIKKLAIEDAMKEPPFPWNSELDKRITSAVGTHGHDWTKVARYVGHGVSRAQCLKHWVDMVDPDENMLVNKGDWAPLEDQSLLAYVKAQRVRGPFGGIDWSRVVFTVGRPFHECRDRLRVVTEEERVYKRRKFTKREDKAIIAMVTKWNGQPGKFSIWEIISEVINRSPYLVKKRWVSCLAASQPQYVALLGGKGGGGNGDNREGGEGEGGHGGGEEEGDYDEDDSSDDDDEDEEEEGVEQQQQQPQGNEGAAAAQANHHHGADESGDDGEVDDDDDSDSDDEDEE